MGDGVSSNGDPVANDEQIGETANRDACYRLVKRRRPIANGVTFGPTYEAYGECYAEYFWADATTDCFWCKDYVTCKI